MSDQAVNPLTHLLESTEVHPSVIWQIDGWVVHRGGINVWVRGQDGCLLTNVYAAVSLAAALSAAARWSGGEVGDVTPEIIRSGVRYDAELETAAVEGERDALEDSMRTLGEALGVPEDAPARTRAMLDRIADWHGQLERARRMLVNRGYDVDLAGMDGGLRAALADLVDLRQEHEALTISLAHTRIGRDRARARLSRVQQVLGEDLEDLSISDEGGQR